MELNTFIEELVDIFEDTNPEEITPDCKFKDLEEWSSLLSLSIIAFAKTEFKKRLTAEDLKNCETIKDLYDLLNK